VSGHTPGPWRLNLGNETEIMDGTGKLNVARAHCGGISGIRVAEAEINARLIAAAPNLLTELEVREGDLVMLIRAIEEGDPKQELLVRAGDMLRETRAALIKARGPA
jgi:hypothetical protein